VVVLALLLQRGRSRNPLVVVDRDNRERYLADDVFMKLFQMDKPTFAALPAWKKKRLKQKVNLF